MKTEIKLIKTICAYKKKTNKNAKTQNRIIKMLTKIKMKTENTKIKTNSKV